MDHGRLCRSSSPRSPPSPHRLDLVAMRQLCWPLLAVVDRALRAQSRGAAVPLGARRSSRVGLCGSRSRPSRSAALPAADGDACWCARPGGAALLAFVLVTLEVRSVFRPDAMMAPDAALHGALVLRRWCGAPSRWPPSGWRALRHDPVALWAWRLSGGLAVATVLVVQVLHRQPDLRAGRCRPPADRQRPVAGLRRCRRCMAFAGAALDRYRAQPERGPARRGGRLDPGLRLCLARGPPLFDPGFERRGLGADGPRALHLFGRLAAVRRGPAGARLPGATRRRCGMPAWRWSASWSPRSS